METFNLSQSYPTQDIKKHTSFLTIGLSICLLAVGISLFFLPANQSESNIDALRIVTGSLLVGISLYFLSFRVRYQAYAGTGSKMYKKNLMFKKGQFHILEKYLAVYCDFPAIPEEEQRLYLLVFHSKDNQYVAFQVLSYITFLYEPVTEPCYLKQEQAVTFMKTLHKSHGFLH